MLHAGWNFGAGAECQEKKLVKWVCAANPFDKLYLR